MTRNAAAVAATLLLATTAATGEWSTFDGGPETVCADGSEVRFLERALWAGSVRVVLVRRIAAPVPAGGVDFDQHKTVDGRAGRKQGVDLPASGTADLSCLTLAEELALAKHLARYPETVAGAAQSCEPHRIVYYLQELAALFHSYYNRQRVLVEDATVTRARLYLVNGVRTVLANALNLLGVDAPERM